MDEHHNWRPSKYVERNGRWRSSLDVNEVGIGSRILADRIAEFHEFEIARHARGRLLDLGCGKAPLLGIYNRYTASITRMDWGASHGCEFVDIRHDINEPLPLDSETFETVILSDVLEHIRNPGACLKEIYRILTPGGKVLANVPFYYWLHEMPYDYYRYTRFGLEYLATDAGFDIEKIEALGGAPEVLFDLVGKTFVEYRITRQLAKLLPSFYRLAMKVRAVQKYSERTSDLFPLAYGMVLSKQN